MLIKDLLGKSRFHEKIELVLPIIQDLLLSLVVYLCLLGNKRINACGIVTKNGTRAPMRILVTGGAGFVGAHLVDRLLRQGHHVLCLDNFYTGSPENLRTWWDHPDLECITHDITEPFVADVDQIYHLACPASPVHYQADPIKTIKTGFMGTLNMLDLAQKLGIKVLISSTSEVYGDPEVHPQPEAYWGHVNPIGIRACYDESKRLGETIAFEYYRQYGTAIRVARIFNTYGPLMAINDGRVVSNFIVQALKGEALTIYGKGTQTRSFCYVDDLVSGLILLMAGDQPGPINLGNPGEFTIQELAELVLELTASTAGIDYQPLPKDDPRQRCPDITQAQEVLGWQPKILLKEGLTRTIPDFQRRLG